MKELHTKAKQDKLLLTASRALVTDGSGNVAISAVTSTELGYLDGVTSNVQTQLNGKQDAISGTANAVMITDSNGKPTVSGAITVQELNYLNNAKSNIQTQIDDINAIGDEPDYVNAVQLEAGTNITYTAPKRGLFVIQGSGNGSVISITIGNFHIEGSAAAAPVNYTLPVAKGQVIVYTINVENGARYFIPYK